MNDVSWTRASGYFEGLEAAIQLCLELQMSAVTSDAERMAAIAVAKIRGLRDVADRRDEELRSLT
jgi:hypothetical protein